MEAADMPLPELAAYCAICGGPFIAVPIKRKTAPKAQGSVSANGAEAEQEHQMGDEHQHQPNGDEGHAGFTATDEEEDEESSDEEAPVSNGQIIGTGNQPGQQAHGYESDLGDDVGREEDGSVHASIELSDVDAEEEEQFSGNDEDDDDLLLWESEEEDTPDSVPGSDGGWSSLEQNLTDDDFDEFLADNEMAMDSEEDEPGLSISYDGNIITRWDVNWLPATMRVLGYNKKSPHISKSFVSGRCFPSTRTARISAGPRHLRDRNYPRSAAGRRGPLTVGLYHSHYSPPPHDEHPGIHSGIHFPFHMPCLELLCRHLTSSPSPYVNANLNKDVLYFSLVSLLDYNPQALMVNYGAAEPSQDRTWVCKTGYEWVVSHPGIDDDMLFSPKRTRPAVSSLLRSTLARAMSRLFVTEDLSNKVRSDPFHKLPYDLLYRLSNLLPDRDLFALCAASWFVHLPLRNNNQFWRYRMIKVSMPWFQEVFYVLAEHRPGNWLQDHRKEWKAILCSLNELLVSDEGKSGILMGIKNRRRIWEVCRVIGREYWSLEKEWREKGSQQMMKEL